MLRLCQMLGLSLSLLCGSNAQGLDFAAAADYSREMRGDAVLVVQNGQILFEEYQNGYDGSRPHPLASGSKSFGCAIAVVAQDEGILRLEEKVADTVPQWKTDPRKSQITVRQLLNFTSGLPGEVGGVGVRNLENLFELALAAPALAAPGERYTYGNTHLAVFGALVKRKTGQDPAEYLHRKVLEPIGARAIWGRDRAGNPNLAGSAAMTARDWAKYGQLVLQGGQWQGRQILSAERLRECHSEGSQALSIYGLTWWLNVPVAGTLDETDSVPVRALGSSRDRLAPSSPPDMFMAAGLGNQRMYLLPAQNMVVVRFGRGGPWSDEEFLSRLLGKK